MQLLNNTVFSFKWICEVGSVHLKIGPCLGQFSLACDAVHFLLIVLEHLHTKLSRCNAVPFLSHILHFIYICFFSLSPCLVVILNWQRQQKTCHSPKRLFACRAVKKICISCHWFPFPLFLTELVFLAGSGSVLIIPCGPQSIHWASLVKWSWFHCIGKSNTFTREEHLKE